MCELCMKHGAGGKWYLNAEHYTEKVVEQYNLRDYLLEQYKNFEQVSVRKVYGFSGVGLGYKLRIPIIGRIIKNTAEKMLHSEKPPKNPLRAEGHIGQVVPLEDAIAIIENCAAEPLIEKNCMCRYMSRGIKEACCINFGVMSEIIEKLPRFIPDKDKFHLTKSEAVKRFTEHNRKGYIGTIWFGPFPYINNLCSCESPECAGIRPRMDFGINSIYKAEYVIQLDQQKCSYCGNCVRQCPFGAISVDRENKTVKIDLEKCFGCGVCRHVCPNDALFLSPRDMIPEVSGQY
ncbi:MAG: 4Fe-4S binding protein [Actinobacteria bacterium]|nr:4Fe-4S binding protein [Actinomycetota bacterium]